MSITLTTDIAQLNQIGQKTAEKFYRLKIYTVRDLLFYFPFRYQDFSQISQIGDLETGMTATVAGHIEMIKNRRSWKRKMNLTEALVSDDTGSVKVIWFNQPYLTKNLQPGSLVYVSGQVTNDTHTFQFVNPVYEKIKYSGETIHTGRLVPVYSLTSGLTEKQIRWLISLSLKAVEQIDEWLPADLITEADLLPIDRALRQIHFPDSHDALEKAVRRLKFDELFLFLLQIHAIKKEIEITQAVAIDFFQDHIKHFVSQLPFVLTDDQRKAAWQIIQDLQKNMPMNRLLEGDVGAGKTVVAALVAYNVILNKMQVAFMAPTEILAHQHFTNLRKLFSQQKINIALLTKDKQVLNGLEVTKAQLIKAVKNGRVDLLVGTHALIQQKVVFESLVLAIIDEQHRFGVEQRKILHQKGIDGTRVPHFLSMTATPIPRSLALTLYGDLDITVIRSMPLNRKKIETKIVARAEKTACYDFIKKELRSGRQAFVVCPLIDQSEQLSLKSVTEEFMTLQEKVFTDFSVAMLHGRMKSSEKEAIMQRFMAGEIDVLVTTSVIEVGVDVPNATVMVIESAERFGLAQLHQLRGRVGRSDKQSYCFLFTEKKDARTRERLEALVTAKDGFALAEKDLEFRGPGEFFGVSQSGWPEFRIASLFDTELLQMAKKSVEKILSADPLLEEHMALKQKIVEASAKIHLD